MKTAVLVLAALMGLSAAGDHRQNSQDCYVKYPNIPGETLLENDRLVVQKFVVRPGQWEGIHTVPRTAVFKNRRLQPLGHPSAMSSRSIHGEAAVRASATPTPPDDWAARARGTSGGASAPQRSALDKMSRAE